MGKISWRAGLNRGPAVYETAALPTELRQQNFEQSNKNFIVATYHYS